MTKLWYAGIGSRETPPAYLGMMQSIGCELGKTGWGLRSGAAKGADTAFEIGCSTVMGIKQIFYAGDIGVNQLTQAPNGDYRGSVAVCKLVARAVHPNGRNLSPQALELHARNTYQLLGPDLNTPVKFVVCYCTKDDKGHYMGGTGQALRMALLLNIPIMNLADYNPTDKEVLLGHIRHVSRFHTEVLKEEDFK